jgi:4-amino-4-deoxy-L-arabinose transferase-like glycosyltransferase
MFKHFKELYESHQKGEVFSIVPLIFLAIVLYLQQAWVPGFFHDGYLYAAFGKHASELGHWLIPHLNFSTYSEFPDHSPFLFMLEGLFFKLFGSGETQARIFGALFSLTTVCCLYLFLEKNTNRKRAFYTTLAFISIYPLIKKTRFPNMDLAIMLSMMLAFFSYYKNEWYKCGFFSGLSLLIKGPIAFLIPLVIFVHFVLTKSWDKLKSPKPWLSFVMAFAIFSLWPLLLYFNGRIDIFTKYLHSTFSHTISGGRGLESYQFHAYFVFLLKQTPHLFLLLIYVLIKKKDDLTKFSLVAFITILLFLTAQKLKYSHYLIVLYPYYALAVGEALERIKDDLSQKVSFFIKTITTIGALVLLIFPLTTKIKRDVPLYETKEVVESIKVKPNAWAIIGDSYPFFAATNFFAYYHHADVYRAKHSMIEAWLSEQDLDSHVIKDFDHDVNKYQWGFLVRSDDVKLWRSQYAQFNEKLVVVKSFNRKGLTLLLPKVYFYSDSLFKLP